MRVAIQGLSTSRFTLRMSTWRARRRQPSAGSRHARPKPCNPRACNTRVRAPPAPPAALRRRRGQCGVRALVSSSGGYLGSASFLAGPSAIVFREKGCRWCCPACCDMAARASAAGLRTSQGRLPRRAGEEKHGRERRWAQKTLPPSPLCFSFSPERKRGAACSSLMAADGSSSAWRHRKRAQARPCRFAVCFAKRCADNSSRRAWWRARRAIWPPAGHAAHPHAAARRAAW
jgi:hypothetical protein